MMETCETCKHWAKYEVEEDNRLWGWGWCEMAEAEDGSPLNTSTLAFANGYKAFLVTRPSFGCNQHEAKE